VHKTLFLKYLGLGPVRTSNERAYAHNMGSNRTRSISLYKITSAPRAVL